MAVVFGWDWTDWSRALFYYNQSVVRIAALGLLLSTGLVAQDKPLQTRPPDQAKPQQQEQEPPEEDESLKPKTYSFNPLEADKDLKVGLYYFKKGNYKAAMSRFHEATLWNPTSAEAFLRLGESAEKLKDKKAAHEAYEKYIALAPNEKQAEAIKKKLGSK
jgi:tetratricopeptide (TPR) repeat protein